MFQESKELPVAEPVKVGKYHQLAEWMREGSKRTKQCRLRNFVTDEDVIIKACAVSAAAIGSGYDLAHRGIAGWALSHLPDTLWREIVILNDERCWTRERIADWLCREGGCEHE